MIRRLLQDRARPGRISRTKATLLGGGLTANVLAQAVLVVARMFGYELNVTEAELATVVSVLVGLVAMWYQREATASAQEAALEAKYHASEAARRNGGAALGLALAALLLPAVAGAVPVHDQVSARAESMFGLVAGCVAVIVALLAGAVWLSLRAGRKNAPFALAALLLLPAPATAQALKPGAGFELLPGDRVHLAWGGAGCPAVLKVRPWIDPWASGLPRTDPEYQRMMCERYGDALILNNRGQWACACVGRGPRGGWPHGINRGADLRAWCEAGLGPPGYDCEPTDREMADTGIAGQTMRARLKSQMCAAGYERYCRPDCPHGWRCTPLSELPAEERPPEARLVRYGPVQGWEGVACSLSGVIWTWVADSPRCWDLPPGCERDMSVAEGDPYDLPASCWEGGPDPPDPTPDPTDPTTIEVRTWSGGWEVDYSTPAAGSGTGTISDAGGALEAEGLSVTLPAVPRPSVEAQITIDSCDPVRGRVVVDRGPAGPFRPGTRSTGRLTYELVERPGSCPEPERSRVVASIEECREGSFSGRWYIPGGPVSTWSGIASALLSGPSGEVELRNRCPPAGGPVEPPDPPPTPDPDPPPPTPGWDPLMSTPAFGVSGAPCSQENPGCTTTFERSAASQVSTSTQAARAVWEFEIPEDGWSSCVSLRDGQIQPAPWCAGAVLTFPSQGIRGTASYVKLKRDGVLLRAGEGRWGTGMKSKDFVSFDLRPGRYRVEQVASTSPRSSTAKITRLSDGQSVTVSSNWRKRGQPSDTFPAAFPAGRWRWWLGGFPGLDNPEEGFPSGWSFGPARVDVRLEVQR